MNVKQLNIFSFYMLGVLFALSICRIFDNIDYWALDFFSQFPFQYALISLLLLSIYLWKKNFLVSVLAGLLFIFNTMSFMDLETSIHAARNVGTTFKVYSANIHKDNGDLSNLNQEIHEIDPDIVLLLEVSPKHKEQLSHIVSSYPYHVQNIHDRALGFVFLSKFPIHNYHVTKLSEFGNSLLEAMLEINRQSIMFYGIHAQRPDTSDFNERKAQFFKPAWQIREQSLPAIVAGDFNMTPYSPIFRKLVSIAGLKDSREGFGWQPSWPTSFPPFWIPIDHILVTSDIHVRKRATGSYIRSDHYPVIAELTLG